MYVQACYEILRSCLSELQRVGLVAGGIAPHTWEELQARPLAQIAAFPSCRTDDACPEQRRLSPFHCVVQYGQPPGEAASACSMALMGVARRAEGLSGRTLRKLPLLAWQRHQSSRGAVHSCAEFISLLSAALNAEQADRLSCGSNSA